MKYLGGYSILDLTDANVSAQANVCYNQDKPVLVYGANGERYFADTIEKVGTSIIITKGGKTITIANDNTITSVGDIQLHKYRITIFSDNNTIYVKVILNNMPFAESEKLTITKEIFDFLSGNDIFNKQVGEEDNGEFPCILYDVNDEDNFTYEIRYLSDGDVASDTLSVTHVKFDKLF